MEEAGKREVEQEALCTCAISLARSLSLSPRAGPAAETLRRLGLGSALPGLQTMKTDWSGGIQRAHSGPVTDTER